ncbi:MAG: GntR family transcriptional regulator [Oscillospiraceae bacterium]|nr:GntR family transcriptional regulator [Oscillospiraceae bacterium]
MKILERLPRETGRDYALRVLKENIINLELAPGSLVSENELSAMLGLSRTPVREALIELSKVKIVDIYPQKGSAVALIDYDLIEEARFMRNLLECAVVELVCEMATPQDIVMLKSNLEMQSFYIDSSFGDMMELDNQFHKMLFTIARKEQVFTLMNNISIHFDRVRRMALYSVKPVKIVEDHYSIFHAIEEKNPEKARSIMEMHLRRYRIDASVIRENYDPSFFKN